MQEIPGRDSIEQLLLLIHGEPRQMVAIREQAPGPQGYSGSQIRYFAVDSLASDGQAHSELLVTKSAVLHERRVLGLLASQACAVPPVVIPDPESEGRSLVVMPFLPPRPERDLGHPDSPLTRAIADGLAGIHVANRGKKPNWMVATSEDFCRYLWLNAWRTQWETNLADPDFAREFGRCTDELDAAMDRFMRQLAAVSAEGDSLTVLNVDLLPDHIRVWRDRACFIDWEQSSYGTFYLDLPNHFTIETVLSYRDALARRGFEIPVLDFMDRFHEISRYMGLRYLGFSLWQWAQGGEQRQQGRWFLHYTLALARNGR